MLFLDPLIRTLVNLKTFSEPEGSSSSVVQRPKVIAHRGCWGGPIFENTMPAFEKAKILGAAGVELDIHFAKDRVPMVSHDPHLSRLFKVRKNIKDHNYHDLQTWAPQLPTLDQVLKLKDMHFMIEVKEHLTAIQQQILEEQLQGLKVGQSFHLLTLDPELVFTTKLIPSTAWILVAQLTVQKFINLTLENNYGGVAGHYFLLKDSQVKQLKEHNKIVGTGFIPNKNLFNREWNRGINFVFTDSLEHLV